ncbi:aminotransferase class V-fold PLP-dependent enzyme [Gemelliphila palaticanis]|uniref:Cysteine desulfurase n=1 Tax=Gemelliphila palaticanis TaxID=81950 RepID=A0ABX2SY87_9BACL|nr:SufS family cysteine desulfurase [Gemella palaticanis]MBF0715340.1 SufS family cysteine desulfurase [Gemella palaticanis]NYS47270.1 SufS family cysteine desulfurase [Gemella palaticanis]
MDIEKIRSNFPILNRKINGNNLVFLDNAATTQKPNKVIDAISDYYKNYNSNIHRSVYTLGNESEVIYNKSKKVVQNFINAKYPEEIIYTSGTTQSLNNISRMLEDYLQEDDEIIITNMEHHANLVPWQELALRKKAKLVYLEIENDGTISLEKLTKLINDKTKILSITYASNVLGTINPVVEIGNLLKDKNIFYIVDAAQAAPHLKINVQEINCDFLVFSGHKMCGPTGIGVLYGKKELLEKISPVNFGGGMISIVDKYKSTWADLPNKFEPGTPLLAEAVGLMAAIEYINDIGIENIENYTQKLTTYLFEKMSEIEGITIYGSKDPSNRVSLISFNLDGVHPHDLASFLDEKAICVRAGHQCTQQLLNSLSTFSVSRVSIYFYNTIEEIDLFVKTLIEIKEFFKNELF